jgi:hypothetical protein
VSDARLLAAERAAAQGEPGARERLILERLRAGAPDPRVDPTPGAAVAASKFTGRYTSRVEREVVRTWPGRLAVRLLVRTHADTDGWLERGTPVLACDRGTRAWPWRVWVKPLPDSPWLDFLTATCPDVIEQDARDYPWLDALPRLPVEAVEWIHSRWAAPRPQRSTLANWRKWARGATVLRLGGGA